MSATIIAPDRTLEQRFNALQHANEIRLARAQVKWDLKAGRLNIVDVLLDPPACVETANVYDLLLAVPWVGRVKANKMLARARVSLAKTVGGLTERQRLELAQMFGHKVTAR